jgi:hypothetical protein
LKPLGKCLLDIGNYLQVNKAILFVGGCADGKRIVVSDDQPYWKMPLYYPTQYGNIDAPPTITDIETNTYIKFPIYYKDGKIEFFKWDKLEDSEAIIKLLQGYAVYKTEERY